MVKRVILGSVFAAGLLTKAWAAQVTLNADDAINTSSFNSAGNWSDATAPHSGNDYAVTGGHTLRSPATGASNVFAGDSLTLGNGTTGGSLSLKSSSNPNTVTIADLRLNNGSVANNQDVTTVTLSGNIMLLSGGGQIVANFMTNPPRNVIVASTITGTSGLLTLTGNTSGGPVILDPVGTNTYAGGTRITGATTEVRKDHALGIGNVTVNSGATLKLTLGGTNDYVADSARLLLQSGSPVLDLSFTGNPDTVAGLSFNGGTTFAQQGLWGAPGNTSADFTDSRITGTGLLNVVPEPSMTAGLLLGGVALTFRRRRRAAHA